MSEFNEAHFKKHLVAGQRKIEEAPEPPQYFHDPYYPNLKPNNPNHVAETPGMSSDDEKNGRQKGKKNGKKNHPEAPEDMEAERVKDCGKKKDGGDHGQMRGHCGGRGNHR